MGSVTSELIRLPPLAPLDSEFLARGLRLALVGGLSISLDLIQGPSIHCLLIGTETILPQRKIALLLIVSCFSPNLVRVVVRLAGFEADTRIVGARNHLVASFIWDEVSSVMEAMHLVEIIWSQVQLLLVLICLPAM